MINSITEHTKPVVDPEETTKPADCCMYIGSANRKVFESLCNISNELNDRSIKMQLNTFCNCLTQLLQKESYYNNLPMMLPQIEENELFLEWIFDDFRFGFLFCTDSSESGWIMTVRSSGAVKSISTKFNNNIPKSVKTISDYLLRLA